MAYIIQAATAHLDEPDCVTLLLLNCVTLPTTLLWELLIAVHMSC